MAVSKSCMRCLAGFFFLVLIAWGTLAIHFDMPWQARTWAAALFAVGSALLLLVVKPRGRGMIVFVAVFCLLFFSWSAIRPSNQRLWERDVARLPDAEFMGSKVIIRNVRDFSYRSTEDFDDKYEERSYNLSELKGVDLFLCYWGPAIAAHSILSFQFGDDDFLAVSIEVRRELDEEYSYLRSFFRQYELIYIFGDERDLIRVRTDYWKQQVYLYRLRLTKAEVRVLFLDYLQRANRLVKRPEFFNSLINNCTLNIFLHQALSAPAYLGVFSGYLDRYIHAQSKVYGGSGLEFEEFKERSLITPRAQNAPGNVSFSQWIRAELPKE